MMFFRKRKLRQAQQDRADAQATYNAAVRRKDTRAMKAARLALKAATHRLMEVENG